MADVFISHSSRDRDRAAALAAALTGRGRSVWWDREIGTGQAFDRAIEQALAQARSVVVLWSAASVESEWVKNEAAFAAERGRLLPASIDGTRPPLEFRRRQTADLAGWHGEPGHDGFQALCRGIDRLVDGGPAPDGVPPPAGVQLPAAVPLPGGAQPSAGVPPPAGAQPSAAVSGRQRRLRVGASVAALAAVLAMVAFVGWRGAAAPSPAAGAPAAVARPAGGGSPAPAGAAAPGGAAAAAGNPIAAAGHAAAAAAPADAAVVAGPADAVAGAYVGEVLSDSRGGSRADVVVVVDRIGSHAVRVSSPYARIGTIDIDLTRVDRRVLNAGGDTPFLADLTATPPTLSLSPRGELSYAGRRR